MVDHRVEKPAKLCVYYSVDVKPNEKALIGSTELAFPLIHELYKECLLTDTYPTVFPSLDLQHTFFKGAREHQLKSVSPIDRSQSSWHSETLTPNQAAKTSQPSTGTYSKI